MLTSALLTLVTHLAQYQDIFRSSPSRFLLKFAASPVWSPQVGRPQFSHSIVLLTDVLLAIVLHSHYGPEVDDPQIAVIHTTERREPDAL